MPSEKATTREQILVGVLWFLVGVQSAATIAALREYVAIRGERMRLAAVVKMVQADVRKEQERQASGDEEK